MGKLRQATLILGEGPTEFFYFKSLCDVFKRLTIKPDYPKHTSIKELDLKIAEGMAMGYSHIFCVIDMDTKNIEPERSQYQKLKTKYNRFVKIIHILLGFDILGMVIAFLIKPIGLMKCVTILSIIALTLFVLDVLACHLVNACAYVISYC